MRFLLNERAAAGIFFVLGAGALLTASTLTFDLVRYVHLQGRAERAVVTIADYASRDPEVDCSQVRALAQFVHWESLGEQSAGVLALTSAVGDADEANRFVEDWTWDPPFDIGPATPPTRLNQCRNDLAANRAQALTALSMTDGEGVVVAQLCLTPGSEQFTIPAWLQDALGMVIYRYHVLPIRAATLSQVCT